MRPTSDNVLQDFPKYERLLLGGKLTEAPDIHVSVVKPTNVRWRAHRKGLEHAKYPREASELHTEVQYEDPKNFKFLLFARDFMPGPLVNYDSGGMRWSGKPKQNRVVSSPGHERHFETR